MIKINNKSLTGKIINWTVAVATGIIITLAANFIWSHYTDSNEEILRMDGVYHFRKKNGENHYLRFYESGEVISKHMSGPVTPKLNSSFSKENGIIDSGSYNRDKKEISMKIRDNRYSESLPSILDGKTHQERQEIANKWTERVLNRKHQILIGSIMENRLKLTVYLSTGENYEANYNFVEIPEFAF